jgi:polysaccharide pyruvyl transferase WcaK-like protein
MSAMPLVGVGVFDYCRGENVGGNNSESRYRDYINKVCTFITWLLDNEYRVRILIGDVTYDNPVREDLRNALEGKGENYDERKLLDEPISSVSDLLQQIATTDMVVATRFHNVLLALMLNKPVISISYDMKNDSLMASVGLSDYCQTLDQFDVSRLIKQFIKLAENSVCLKRQIEEIVKGHRQASLEQYSTIFANS